MPARRLSNAEYDHTIRDLTGVDLRPTQEFPVDPANKAGFDNSAESLAMSPALVKKYLDAARGVADHLVLKPQGFAFASHPVVADTDRDKYCVRRIIDFYKRQRTDYADFFLAAWRFRHREALGRPNASLADFAAEAGISPKYLAIDLVDPDGTERRSRADRRVAVVVARAPAAKCTGRRTPRGRVASGCATLSSASQAAHPGGEEPDRPRHSERLADAGALEEPPVCC